MKRLYRSRDERIVAGICGGIGEYASVDPTLVRLGVLLATVFTAVFPMLIAYLIAWAIVPERPQGTPSEREP